MNCSVSGFYVLGICTLCTPLTHGSLKKLSTMSTHPTVFVVRSLLRHSFALCRNSMHWPAWPKSSQRAETQASLCPSPPTVRKDCEEAPGVTSQ